MGLSLSNWFLCGIIIGVSLGLIGGGGSILRPRLVFFKVLNPVLALLFTFCGGKHSWLVLFLI